MAFEYKDGNPVVDDRYNVATSFTLRADMPNGVEMVIASEGDNGILFEGTEGRFFVNRGRIAGKPVDDLKDNPPAGGSDRGGVWRTGQREPHARTSSRA